MFQAGTGRAERGAAARRAGALVRFNYATIDAIAVKVPNANALAGLGRELSVSRIIPDRPVFAVQSQTARPGGGGGGGGSSQTVPPNITRVKGNSTRTGAGVGVAVLDTGVDLAHPDLTVAQASFDAFGGNADDDNGHGTHVAGIIAARNNNIDVVGVAPEAVVYAVKVLNASGSGSDATVLAGLDWVAANRNLVNPRIQVVNMSLGRDGTLGDNPVLEQAVQNIAGSNISVVVAADNDPNQEVSQNVPATYPWVFAVASTTAAGGSNQCRAVSNPVAADTASYFTTDGRYDPATGIGVTVSAPGAEKENISRACFLSPVGILLLASGGGTTRSSGTSMAAPHVAGVVALIIQAGVAGLTTESARSWLRTNADRIGTAPLNSPSGAYTYDGEREGIVKAPL